MATAVKILFPLKMFFFSLENLIRPDVSMTLHFRQVYEKRYVKLQTEDFAVGIIFRRNKIFSSPTKKIK